MKGIIYKYTSPSGKVYIGQTTNEKKRRQGFLCITNESYTKPNSKIDRARKKYHPSNFIYEILFTKEYENGDGMVEELNELEKKYIIENIDQEISLEKIGLGQNINPIKVKPK